MGLSVGFTGRYSVLSGTRLMQRANTMETRDLYWFGAPGKRIKALCPVTTLFVLRSRQITRWRLQDSYAYESFDDYNRADG
jgi:hypothetical protein